jgi:signal transduction histidine kinase
MGLLGIKSSPRKLTGWLFVGTVALGYAATLWYRDIDVATARGRWCVSCGLVYAALGYLFSACDDEALLGWIRPMIMLGLSGLLAAILFTARMNGDIVLCVFPAAAVAVKLLRPLAAVVAEAVIFAIAVAAEARFADYGWAWRRTLSIIPAFAFVVLITKIAVRATEARKKAERLSLELEEANRQLRAQSDRMAEIAMIQERNRLARDIHDGLGHYLTTICVQLEAAEALQTDEPGRALDSVVKARGLAREALVEVRRSVGSLKADEVSRSLVDRLRDLAASVDDSTADRPEAPEAPGAPARLSVRLEILGAPRPLAPEAEVALFRAAQEGLTNVRKHAAAHRATVILDYREPARVVVQVGDDGRGCARAEGGQGLVGLRERFALLGGEVRAQNGPGGGFRLEAAIPARLDPRANSA